MSLNKFTDDSKQKSWMKINAKSVITDDLKFQNSETTSFSLDFSGLLGSVIKTDLTTETTQQKYGNVERYTALTNLSAGQPVVYDYSSGNIKCTAIGALPSQHEIIGICLNDTLAGETADILVNGYGTCRRTTTFASSSETVSLNNTTNGTTRSITNNTTFTDSGNGGNYQPNENYSITFDAGVGYTIDLVINSFGFEHTTSLMYDRLGIQTSNDGVNFSNISVQYLQTSATTTPPYSSSFGGPSYNSVASINGWILPLDEARAISLGGVPGNTFPANLSLGARFVRFYFFSDSSNQDQGWNITIKPNTPYPTPPETVAEGATLYLDNSDYTKVSTDNTSQIVVGYCSYNNAENDSILVNVRVPKN